ncbi:MAG TPA: LysR family transcriptional regulator [Phycisphaerae bacterium]|jgi:DNA-binding transcriptional LysR family regulator|nr:LysR family transcriptional regulator [Phycisphaerae bacterium]
MDDVHKLRVFAAVAQTLSFTRAAQGLHLTQSAVSHAIAGLEREMDAPLLRREGKRISLTEPGRVLLEHSRRVFAVLEEAGAAVKRAARPDRGLLRIGASPAACQYLVPESLREFRESYPEFELAIAVGDSPHIARQVHDGHIDLGLLIRAEKDKQLAFHELFTDDLGILVSPYHAFAKQEKIDRRQLLDQHFVLYTRTSATFRAIERHLLKLEVPLRSFTELGSMEAIKELVKLGLGITVAASWIAAPEIAQGSLLWLRLPGPPLRRHWSIGCRAGRRLSIAEQTFVGLCRTTAENLVLHADAVVRGRK